MDDTSRPESRISAATWRRFLELVHAKGARPPFDRWYVIRAEQFERSLQGKAAAACAADDVTAFLQAAGRSSRLEAWQFRQIVEAIELLLSKALRLPWAEDFDWAFWRDSARSLPPKHATIAQESEHAAVASAIGAPSGSEGLIGAVRSRFAGGVIPTEPSRRTCSGFAGSSDSAKVEIRERSAPTRSRRSSSTWPCGETSRQARRTRR